MTPEQTLKRMTDNLKQMSQAKKHYTAVGVMANEATSKVYPNGANVLTVAAAAEFGYGAHQRSFLRMPQDVKKKEISKFISDEFEKVLSEKRTAKKSLGRIGVMAVNITQEAFQTSGFGRWPENAESTVAKKGSSKPLIDKGILRNSVTWEVR